jgi:D-glycero-alpha-D-manno-heptose-7-phosphate kinase
MKVRATAWCRVDLGGGTLDIWPLGLLHRGARTVNLAIDLPVVVELEPRATSYRVEQGAERIEGCSLDELKRRPESSLIGVVVEALGLPPCSVRIDSSSPRGGGLGASSALAVALIGAGEKMIGRGPSPPEARAALARDLEARLMGLPTGRQDHFPALLGGVLEIHHEIGGERIRTLDVDGEALGRCLLVAYTGQSHFSAGKNWQVIRRRLDRDEEIVDLFDGISRVSGELPEALESGDLKRVGELMSAEWSYRSHLAEGVSTPLIERLLQTARDGGAWGGKACGAGGGGSIAMLVPEERKTAVAERLTADGATMLEAAPIFQPLKVETL